MSDTRAKAMLGGGGRKSSGKSSSKHKRKVVGMHIKRGASGGFIVKHEMEQDPTDPSAPQMSGDHVVADPDQLQQHVSDTMGDQPPVNTTPPAAPPAAGGAPPPSM